MAIVTGLILLFWQPSLATESAAPKAIDSDAIASIDALREQYQRLQVQLSMHRALADRGGWPAVPEGPTLRADSDDRRLDVVARRLAISGDLQEDAAALPDDEYRRLLQTAVRRFQARHGLADDGLVGRATLRALNVPVERRIDQIRVNLERARRLSRIKGPDLVLVNSAAFRAYVILQAQTVWTTEVIVGETKAETPEFRSELTYIVFNPTWSVPHSIAAQEMLPKIRRDPGFFKKGGYRLYDRDGNIVDPGNIDWSAVSVRNFPFSLLQVPGPANQLGKIKFMFPNEYSVYMHDTPEKSLFARPRRALSHGCIRVNDARSLAELLLRSDGWTGSAIDAQLASGKTKTVFLSRSTPLHVLYWTAEVDGAGRIYFYDDIYGRDAKAIESLDIAGSVPLRYARP